MRARAWPGFLIALVAALVVCPGAWSVAGPAAPLPVVHVALTTGAANASVYVTDGLGYLAAQGLQVEIVNLGGSSSEIAAAAVRR